MPAASCRLGFDPETSGSLVEISGSFVDSPGSFVARRPVPGFVSAELHGICYISIAN
jgi:hypothetical protein